jgi:hypothetical protein
MAWRAIRRRQGHDDALEGFEISRVGEAQRAKGMLATAVRTRRDGSLDSCRAPCMGMG